jgi:hypothetical protein
MLDVRTRIVADRSLGKVFFNDYYLMDVDPLSDPSRWAIQEQVAKRGDEPFNGLASPSSGIACTPFTAVVGSADLSGE